MAADDQLHSTIATLYEAATGGGGWDAFGDQLADLVRSTRVVLLRQNSDGLVEQPIARYEWSDVVTSYATYYHRIDRFREGLLNQSLRGAGHLALFGEQIVPDDEFLASEIYNDFLKPNGLRWMLGAQLDLNIGATLSVHRGDDGVSFSRDEHRLFQAVLPHFERALQIERRLKVRPEDLASGLRALDYSPMATFVVGGNSNVVFANVAARLITQRSPSALQLIFKPTTREEVLVARCRRDHDKLARLIRDAARGHSGGVMRLHHDAGEIASLAVLVSPVPTSLVTGETRLAPILSAGSAMILVREIKQSQAPAALLSSLFGLTDAEAEVGALLIGGTTAETVAARRGASLATVRVQIRSLLQKADAASLREFEHIAATISLLQTAKHA